MKTVRHFVGREAEIQLFNEMLQNPEGPKRILYFVGPGGIGKTKLIQEVLSVALLQAEDGTVLIPQETNTLGETVPVLIDLYATENRTIDGLQRSIIKILGKEHFSEFLKPRQDTSMVFRACMHQLCEKITVVLAFDTFELVHDDVVAEWILRSGERDLQMSNLICLIGSRPPKLEMSNIISLLQETSIFHLTEIMDVPGIDLDDALVLYAQINEIANDDVMDDRFWIRALVEKVEGNPLSIRLAYEFLRLERHQPDTYANERRAERWQSKYIQSLSKNEFEEELMRTFQELGYSGKLDASQNLSEAAFKTIVCMSYLTRRFSQAILGKIIKRRLIHTDLENEDDVIKTLVGLFFVKPHKNGGMQLQLHDEMARLTKDYLWKDYEWGKNAEGEWIGLFQEWILVLYDELTVEENNRHLDQNDNVARERIREKIAQLKAEKLYYTLELDLEQGLHFFYKLVDEGDSLLNKLLPGEMIRVIGKYESLETRFAIYRAVAVLEQKLGHVDQGRAYWLRAEQIANDLDDDRLRIDAWVGLHNITWETNPQESLQNYLEPARTLAEKSVPDLLPTVLYETGFAYRRKEDIETAIRYYREALGACKAHTPDDKARLATISNDLGFALALSGEYNIGLTHVTEARDLRTIAYDEARANVAKIQIRLEYVPDSDSDGLKNWLDKELLLENRLAEQLGMTYATEGRIARYGANLPLALYNYRKAMELFEKGNDFRWQAIVSFRMGETLRRMARVEHSQGNFDKRVELLDEAYNFIKESIYLCEKYNYSVSDTAYRRMGRLLHDQALWHIVAWKRTGEGKHKENAAGLLDDAKAYFDKALAFAERTTHDLREQFESRTEIVFLQDDWLELLGEEYDPEYIREQIEAFQNILDSTPEAERIYQQDVFGYLLQIEWGAYYYELAKLQNSQENYAKALDHYLTGFAGMASSPGYGYYRYNLHLDHLKMHIEDIDDDKVAIEWCKALDHKWSITQTADGKSTLGEVHSGIVGWISTHIQKRREKRNQA